MDFNWFDIYCKFKWGKAVGPFIIIGGFNELKVFESH